MAKIYLESLSSEICEDFYDEGEGDCIGAGIDGVKIGESFSSMKEMFKWLHQHYGLYDKESEYDCDSIDKGRCDTDKLVADHSDAQNGGWFEPTPDEIKAWKKGKMKLYNEHFYIQYHKY